MVSVERRKLSIGDSHSDWDSFIYNHIGVERSFPSKLLYSGSLFDYDSVDMKKDMEFGPTLLDSVFPSIYSGIRRGRNHSYDVSSTHSQYERTDPRWSSNPSSDVRVIPIKFQHSPERYQDNTNVKFRLLNGSPKDTEDGKIKSHFVGDLPKFKGLSSTSLSPSLQSDFHKNYQTRRSEGISDSYKGIDSPSVFTANSSGSFKFDGYSHCDSSQNLRNSYSENYSDEKKADVWKSIPVRHVESTSSPEKPNSNNNSSDKGNINVPSTSSTTKSSNSSTEDEDDITNLTFSRLNNLQSVADVTSDHDFEEREVNYPPSYPIYDVLKVKLAKENRTIDYIRGDGNCFFRALSKVLYGSEQYHKTVRSFIVDIIACKKSKFAPFVDKEDVQEHVMRMAEDHSWATTCEIYAAATLLQRDIYMLTPDHLNQDYSWLLFKPVFKMETSNDITNHTCYISLCNTNGNHYDRVVPDHGGCNCFLPHPQLGKVV